MQYGNDTKGLKYFLFLLVLLIPGHASIAFAGGQAESLETIHGTLWYRERIMPPPGAEIVVSLVDAAKMDVAATKIASTGFGVQGGPPWDFTLQYDPQKLNSKGRYVLQARLEADGRLFFITTSSIPAFDHDAEDGIRIMMNRVAGSKAAAKPDSTLSNTYWKVVEISGHPVGPGAGGKEVHMILNDTEKRVKGFSGCNNFGGGFELQEKQLSFGPLAATMMACAEGMQLEQQFLQALGGVKHLTISGEALLLYDSNNQMLLRFAAVYLQ